MFQQSGKIYHGQVLNFIEFQRNTHALLKKYQDKIDMYSFLMLSKDYSQILSLNSFDKYFKIFDDDEYDVILLPVNNLRDKCLKISLSKNKEMPTPVLDFEHD
jgi:hypothetical protein